ncbi:MAG: hypothetical protein A2Z66_04500 [Chloroflexi bacterium RBG_13_66_10]|nr:MAG: hypothetical protein A2Z66_04500 [Chloroflexi bacterium RBG_13_66_10]
MPAPSTLRLLLTGPGREALQEAQAAEPRPEDFLALVQKLERRFPSALAAAAAEQAILRRKARAKFREADRMFFATEALEQATAQPVAEYRAARFASLAPVFDLTCGLGGDALALAQVAPVIASDIDRVRLLLLAANASALGPAHRVTPVLADARRPPWGTLKGAGAFLDPGRRQAGRRARSVNEYEPPLAAAVDWAARVDGLGAKISPAVDLAEVAAYDCEIEFIDLGGELREAVLWFGCLKTVRRRATVLPGPHTLVGEAEPEIDLAGPDGYLYEPSPAVMRAGLVRTLGAQIGASMLDRRIAFLVSDRLVTTPFARAYEVAEAIPFQLKRLRARLRELGIGPLTVKKRGSPIQPEDLIRSLGLRGEEPGTVVLTQVKGKPYALIVRPVAAGSSEPG